MTKPERGLAFTDKEGDGGPHGSCCRRASCPAIYLRVFFDRRDLAVRFSRPRRTHAREASGLACRRGVVVALGLGSRADALCLYRRAQVDAQHHPIDTSLAPYHKADMNTEISAR